MKNLLLKIWPLLALVWMLLAFGCIPTKIVNTTKSTKSDSTHVEESQACKDTSVTTKADSINASEKVTVKNGVATMKPIFKKSKNSTISAGIYNNKLFAKCKCDALELKIKLLEKTIKIYREKKEAKDSTNTVIVTEQYIPWWAKILSVIGGIALMALIIFIVVKIYT
jgi:hypothetical protein